MTRRLQLLCSPAVQELWFDAYVCHLVTMLLRALFRSCLMCAEQHSPLCHIQVWIGYNQSLRPCQSGLTLNTDITAAAFLEGQPMLQLIGGTVGMMDISRGLNPQQVRSINKAVRGVQVSSGFAYMPWLL